MNKKKAKVLRKISKLTGKPYRKLKHEYVRVNEQKLKQEKNANTTNPV